MATFLKIVLGTLLLCFVNRAHCSFESYKYHTLQLSSLLPSSACTTSSSSSKGLKGKVSLKVVHRNGPCSHLKDNSPTLSQILAHDQSRVESIRSRISRKNAFPDSKTTILANTGASLGSDSYVVTVGLGSPKKDLSLTFDTGSDLTWTQCQPCVSSCYAQQQPIFDPSLSTSYSNITCTSPSCSDLTTTIGNNPRCSGSTCVYGIQYDDRSFSFGYFVKDKLTLSPTDVLDGFLFGCGQNNQGLYFKTAGILGLGRDKLSIISQSAQKYKKYFSYCLPSVSSSTGYLTLGKSGVSENVVYTTFARLQGSLSYYFINVMDIYVGGTRLSISPTVFSNGGTIIDSGTVITRLPPDAYNSLSTAVQKQMKNYPKAPAFFILDTCYDFSNYTTVTYPKISFLFGGNVKVNLDATGIFYVVNKSQVCLAFAGNNDTSDVGILGNVQQKRLQVIYDVAGGKLGFGSSGCD